jgi:hypothetical protein
VSSFVQIGHAVLPGKVHSRQKVSGEAFSKIPSFSTSFLKGLDNAQKINCLEEFVGFYWNNRAELKLKFSSRDYFSGFMKGIKSNKLFPKEKLDFEEKLSFTSEFTTFEGTEDFLSLILNELRKNRILPSCSEQKGAARLDLTHEAHSLISQLKNLPVHNPWANSQNMKTGAKVLMDELIDESVMGCSGNLKNHLLNWMSRAFRSNIKFDEFKKAIFATDDFEESRLPPSLKDFALNTFESKALREWDPFFREKYKNIPSQKNLFDLLEKIESDLIERGFHNKKCEKEIPLSAFAQEDLRALRLASLRDDFTALVKESVKNDESCTKVITGNDGEKSVSEIESSSRSNVDKEYPFFMAYSFLGMACKSWSSLSSDTMKGFNVDGFQEWQKVHPFKRPVFSLSDLKNDALTVKEFRLPRNQITELNQTEKFKQDGLHNLIFGQSLVYSLAVRETSANPLLGSSSHQAEVNKDTGLCHNSATSLGTNVGMTDGSDSLFPFAMDLLKNYVQKARYLASDSTPQGMNRFKNFCGTSSFEDEYKQKGVKDPQSILVKVLSSKVSVGGKSETCDEAIEAGVKSYKAANIASCFRALQIYCPNYGVAHANLVVRAMKRNNGPLSNPKKGVRPACHQVFSDIVEVLGTTKGKRLCELTEDFSIQ